MLATPLSQLFDFFFEGPERMSGREAPLALPDRVTKSPSDPIVVGVVFADTSCSPKHSTCIDGVPGEPSMEEKAPPMAPRSSEHMSVRRTCLELEGAKVEVEVLTGDIKD